MPEPYRAEQGTIVPTLFMGVGGIGSRIVNRIALRAGGLPNWSSQLKPLTAFVAIDTNQFDLDQLHHVPAGNRLHIGGFDKVKVIENFRADKNHQALQWLPANYQPRSGIKPGAGQIRMESRLGSFYNSPELRKRLARIVKDTLAPGIVWRRNDPPNYFVYLFCTVAGGTGSGSFLPMAYLVRDIVRNEGTWQPRVIGSLLLSTMATGRVDTALHGQVHANAYAALKELEHLTKLDYKQVKSSGRTSEPFAYHYDPTRRNDDVPTVNTAPFFLGLIYDKSNVTIVDVSGVEGPVAAVADTAFLQLFTPNIGSMASALDNYEKNLEELARFSGDLKDVGQGYTKNFGAVGAAALVLPGADLLEYCAMRFAAESLRGQITFGVGRDGDGDDRSRALAPHAVNYDDPKFLKMSDEGRDEAINTAFGDSVRELAHQDERQDLPDGYWTRLVQSVDLGPVTGRTDTGEPQRGETLVQRIRRLLDEARRPLMSRVSIKEKAFLFQKESVGQYPELVSRLREEIRAARVVVEEGMVALRSAARDGEVVAGLKLDPLTERYLIMRLLERCQAAWIPETQKLLDGAKPFDIGNPKVVERLDEYYKQLQDAGAAKKFVVMRDDEAFLGVRGEAEDYYRRVAKASRSVFDAELSLAQLRSLLEYLQRRSRQYARLARHVNTLTEDLEVQAETLRRGSGGATPRLALSVEVFETLDEPRERIWLQVFRALFVEGGRYLTTFDRNTLASAIAEQLKPEVRASGTVAEKSDERILHDLRDALVELGRKRLGPAIVGGGSEPGLDVARGLELEATIVLSARVKRGESVPPGDIDAYISRKIQALDQLSGILARSSASEWAARGDGVAVDRTRYIVHGPNIPQRFFEALKSQLGAGGRTLNPAEWHDPRIVIVYDVEVPIPLYYIRPILDELEPAYLKVQSDETRAYNLHIDYNWEESLPNLNPRRAEISVGWALKTMAEALTVGAVYRDDRAVWRWRLDETTTRDLGERLSVALYNLGELHRRQDLEYLRKLLEDQIRQPVPGGDVVRARQQQADRLKLAIRDIELRKLEGKMTPQDSLDRPILHALITLLEGSAVSG